MKKPFSDKRWNDIPQGKIINDNNPTAEELKELKNKANKMKKEIEDKKKKDAK